MRLQLTIGHEKPLFLLADALGKFADALGKRLSLYFLVAAVGGKINGVSGKVAGVGDNIAGVGGKQFPALKRRKNTAGHSYRDYLFFFLPLHRLQFTGLPLVVQREESPGNTEHHTS